MTPSPGQYEYKTYLGKEAPKITIASRPNTSGGNRGNTVGPGQYNINLSNKNKSPSYRIGSAKRDGGFEFLRDNPGPSQYSPSYNTSTRPKSPTWSMGKGTRTNMNPMDFVPGTGSYNISKGIGEGPKYTITGKNFYNGGKLGVPGPGNYNSTLTHLSKNPSWR
jgi:hypothetical protein